MIKFPQDTSSSINRSTLAETMNLDSNQESEMLKIFESCGIGEITTASVFQTGDEHTSYHLEDEETAFYRGVNNTIVVWVNNSNKTVESIHFKEQDIYLEGEVLTPITDYYVDSTARNKYRTASELAVKKLLNYPNTAKFPSISGWTFNIEDGIVVVQSTFTAKNAFNMESKSEFQVKFDPDAIISLIIDGQEYMH